MKDGDLIHRPLTFMDWGLVQSILSWCGWKDGKRKRGFILNKSAENVLEVEKVSDSVVILKLEVEGVMPKAGSQLNSKERWFLSF